MRPQAWALWVVALFVCGVFALAWWAFAFPLTYCDSPAWAPAYLTRLLSLGAPLQVAARGVLVPAWFATWGELSLATGAANAIGAAQGALLLAAVLAVLRFVQRGATLAELLVAPAFALAGLRHAVYAQTILSESLAVGLALPVALLLLRERAPSLRLSAALGALAALATGARAESLLLLLLLLARLAAERAPWRERAQRLGVALATAALVLGALTLLTPTERGAPINKSVVVAEWMRFSQPPHNPLASALHSELADQLVVATAAAPVRDVYGGLEASRRLFVGPDAPGWPEILRLLAYQAANRPLVVFADRLGTLGDLWASGYAAFWPGYRAWSPYYSPYDQVFARWRQADFDEARSSCPVFAQAQAARYRRAAVRSPAAFAALRALHTAAEPYARWPLRFLFWAAVPASLVVLGRRSAGGPYLWLTLLVWGQLAARATFTPADERYELPVDLLALAWLSLTLRHSLPAAAAIASPADSPRSGS